MGTRTPKRGARAKAGGAKRRDLYQEVTDRIIDQLELGARARRHDLLRAR